MFTILSFLIAFLLGILVFISQEHIRNYFKIVSSIKATHYYFKKMKLRVSITQKHFKNISDGEYALEGKPVNFEKFFSDQFSILPNINNQHFLDIILQPIVEIEKFTNNLEFCYFYSINHENRSPIYTKFFHKTYDGIEKTLEILPTQIENAIREIDKIFNQCCFKRYIFIRWHDSIIDFRNNM